MHLNGYKQTCCPLLRLYTGIALLLKLQLCPRKAFKLATKNCKAVICHVRFINLYVVLAVSGFQMFLDVKFIFSALHLECGRRSFIGRLVSSLFSIMIRRLTPSITLWTSSTSENPSLSRLEISKILPSAAVSKRPVE